MISTASDAFRTARTIKHAKQQRRHSAASATATAVCTQLAPAMHCHQLETIATTSTCRVYVYVFLALLHLFNICKAVIYYQSIKLEPLVRT